MVAKEKSCLNCKAIYRGDKCPQCGESIKWQEQHEYEDFNLEGEGIINVHFCTNIDCNVEEVYIFQKDDA